MKLVIFDFDGTLYKKDSTVEFCKYIYKTKPFRQIYIFKQLWALIRHWVGIISTTQFKNDFFLFLKDITPESLDLYLADFWTSQKERHFRTELLEKIKILQEENCRIICISASPLIFLNKICEELMIDEIIATNLKYKNNRYVIAGDNCRGPVKIKRLTEKYNLKDNVIHEAYSDNKDDIELLKLAKKGYLVQKNMISKI